LGFCITAESTAISRISAPAKISCLFMLCYLGITEPTLMQLKPSVKFSTLLLLVEILHFLAFSCPAWCKENSSVSFSWVACAKLQEARLFLVNYAIIIHL
jgi:hypothetical protein